MRLGKIKKMRSNCLNITILQDDYISTNWLHLIPLEVSAPLAFLTKWSLLNAALKTTGFIKSCGHIQNTSKICTSSCQSKDSSSWVRFLVHLNKKLRWALYLCGAHRAYLVPDMVYPIWFMIPNTVEMVFIAEALHVDVVTFGRVIILWSHYFLLNNNIDQDDFTIWNILHHIIQTRIH